MKCVTKLAVPSIYHAYSSSKLICGSQFKNVRNNHFSIYLLLIQMSTFYLSESFFLISFWKLWSCFMFSFIPYMITVCLPETSMSWSYFSFYMIFIEVKLSRNWQYCRIFSITESFLTYSTNGRYVSNTK